MTELQQQADKLTRRKKTIQWGLYMSLIGVVAFAVVSVILFFKTDNLEEGQGVLTQGLDQLNSSLKNTCERVDPNTLPAATREDCDRAKRDEKPPVVEQAPTEIISVPANPAEVREQVEDYFRRNPVQNGPTVAQVLEMVNQVYNANPPKDAPPVSVEQRAADVASYCANNRCRGEQGERGLDGQDQPPVTNEQIFSQVKAFCATTTPIGCAGKQGEPGAKGETGAQGRGVVNRAYDFGATPPDFWDSTLGAPEPADPDQCYEFVTYSANPAFPPPLPVNVLFCTP